MPIKCKHCEFLENTFTQIDSNREYWLYTEMFVYLHSGADHCSGNELNIEKVVDKPLKKV